MLSHLNIGMAWAEIQEELKVRSAEKIYLESLLKWNTIYQRAEAKTEFR